MYSFEDKNNQYINEEVDLRLSELTAQGLVKSEDEYKKIIDDTIHNIDFSVQRITDAKKYFVKKEDMISSIQLNNLFTDLTSDMRILHKELDDIHKVLDLTFERNQLFYRRIKNRIASIWKEIQYFRENSFNLESSTYTFFESFSEDSLMYLTGVMVDKKTGTLVLQPAYINNFSDASEISDVDMTVYPAANNDGGVVDTTNAHNTLAYNYTNGDRTMLKEGLWKIQMLTADIPEVILDVFNRGKNLRYHGIIATVDITFTNQKLINEITIDPYGDFTTTVLGVSYKLKSQDNWKPLLDSTGSYVTGSDVDWIRLRNFPPVTAKMLRITFHQPNYQIIQRLLTKVDKMVDKMVTALLEKRFEKINYNYKQSDQFPRYDTSDEADLYDEIMNVIETGGEITTLETQIKDLLVPTPINIKTDISNWKLFNLGAWSIDPRNIAYDSQAVGVYISHDPRDHKAGYQMNKGCPLYAKLYTKQDEPQSTAIQWSLMADIDGSNYLEIPIIPNNDMWRNELLVYGTYTALENGNRVTSYNNKSSVFKLDFPVHPNYQTATVLLENGDKFVTGNLFNIDFYNSTEVYVPDAALKNGSIYGIKYIPAVIDTVRCWTIVPTTTPTGSKQIDFSMGCVFATKEAAQRMINVLASAPSAPNNIYVSPTYTIVSQLCTRKEYDSWFLQGVTNTFIDNIVLAGKPYWFVSSGKYYYNSSNTRLSWLFDNSIASLYSEGKVDKRSWNTLPSAVPQIKIQRTLY